MTESEEQVVSEDRSLISTHSSGCNNIYSDVSDVCVVFPRK
jgi:hypothetical protein